VAVDLNVAEDEGEVVAVGLIGLLFTAGFPSRTPPKAAPLPLPLDARPCTWDRPLPLKEPTVLDEPLPSKCLV